MGRRVLKWLAVLALACAVSGCATSQPPEEIRSAVSVVNQFTTHTYTLRDGKIIYSKGNDHIVDAVRCAMLVREEGNLDPIGEEMVSLKPVITNPVFI